MSSLRCLLEKPSDSGSASRPYGVTQDHEVEHGYEAAHETTSTFSRHWSEAECYIGHAVDHQYVWTSRETARKANLLSASVGDHEDFNRACGCWVESGTRKQR